MRKVQKPELMSKSILTDVSMESTRMNCISSLRSMLRDSEMYREQALQEIEQLKETIAELQNTINM